MTHDSMVEKLVAFLVEKGHTDIKCALPDYTQPLQISWKDGDGHIPDVTSTHDKTNHIFEVETTDTIDDEHTISQLKLFSANAKQYSKVFVVVVPKASKDDIQTVLTNNSVSATIWTIG